MAKRRTAGRAIKKPFVKLIYWICWITGVLVSLAVGFGMADGTLTIPYFEVLVPLAGWIVIILTIIGAIIAIIQAAK